MQDGEKKDSAARQSNWRLLLTLGVIVLAALTCLSIAAVALVASGPANSKAAERRDGSPAPALLGDNPLAEPEELTQATPPVATATTVPLTPQSGGRSAGDPYIPELGNTGYDVQRYILQLALDPSSSQIEAKATIEAVSTLDGLAELSLDFAGFDVTSVTVDGLIAQFWREDKKLIITLPNLLPNGAPFTMVVVYRGQPLVEPSPYVQFVDHMGLHYPDGESLFTIAEPDGARFWFPANDHPRDKATFRFEIVVPAGLTALANGEMIDMRPGAMPNGQLGTLYVWEHNYPMAPYLALVAAGRYEQLNGQSPDGVPLRTYHFPELKQEVITATNHIGQAIDWMSGLLGPYPFETFGYATARVPGASMETQTLVLLSDAMIGPRTAVHEMAHMWFGDWVSLDSWAEMWRNEGFATYMSLLWLNRDDPEDLELELAGIRSAVEGNDKSYPLNNPPPTYLFEFNVYYGGALVVHDLRQTMGDEAFFSGLRTYFERFGGSTASDAQFQAVMEQAAGFSLEPFFAEWFPRP